MESPHPYQNHLNSQAVVVVATKESLSHANNPSRMNRRAGQDKDHMMQMEKLVLVQQQRDMVLMKTAMLKHEETFRQQVHDLHRLYRIQKQLMNDLAMRPSTVLLPCQQGHRRRQHPRRPELNLKLPVAGRQVMPSPRGSEDELELTLALGHGVQRRRESTPSTTTSSSTDSSGAVEHQQRGAACELREGVMVKQPQWLVQCLSLRMA